MGGLVQPAAAPRGEPHVELRGISKHFGGVQAVTDVSLSIERGSVHALVGENGAGKSTLGKIIAGMLAPDAGELIVDGRPVHYRSPHDALADGLTIMAQELALVPSRSVVENVFLGFETRRRGVVQRRAVTRRFTELCDEVGFELPPHRSVRSLPIAEQQKVEILRALARRSALIVMDEPTAALGIEETEQFFHAVQRVRERGTTIVFVSHFLNEVLQLSDTITILRDGRLIRTSAAAGETPAGLVTAMLGRALDQVFPPKVLPKPDAPVVLSARGLSSPPAVNDVSLTVRSGEIVGLAGLVGSGRSETVHAIFGARPVHGGVVELDGQPLSVRSPADAIRNGLALVPEDRKGQGLLMQRAITDNVTLPHLRLVSTSGVVARRDERRRAGTLTSSVGVAAPDDRSLVATLSGGNQQKVLFARWLFERPKVLIADEPTRGVDVGAKRAIYDLIASLAAQGTAVIVISSDVEEILGLAHRIVVMRGGRSVAEFSGADATEDRVIRAAFGTETETETETA